MALTKHQEEDSVDQLGFDGLKELESAHPLFLAENEMPPIFPDAIRCLGNETSLSTCPIIDEDLSACTRYNETAVRCNCEYIPYVNQLFTLQCLHTLHVYV